MFNKKTLVVFGDSNVWGAELKDVPERQYEFKSIVYDPDHIDTWPYHIRHSFSGVIAERNNMQILNLAIPGCSNDTIFRRVNQFAQGKYPVDLNDCFVMVFWTSVSRREFFRPDINVYLNYSPAWSKDLQLFPKFHKEYVKTVLHEEYDIKKTYNYIFSINALLQNLEFVQGYALQDEKLANLVKTNKLPNFLSYDPYDAIASTVIIEGNGTTNNPLIFSGHHPNENGHKFLAEKYTKLIDNFHKR
jgi:hypothetical protein